MDVAGQPLDAAGSESAAIAEATRRGIEVR